MTRNAYLFPHSSKEFPTVETFQKFILCELPDKGGAYHVATSAKYQRILPGSPVLFHKRRMFFGKGKIKDAVKPYKGSDISPASRKPYEGTITFDPESIRLFPRAIAFDDVERTEKKAGLRLNPRVVQKIDIDTFNRIVARL